MKDSDDLFNAALGGCLLMILAALVLAGCCVLKFLVVYLFS